MPDDLLSEKRLVTISSPHTARAAEGVDGNGWDVPGELSGGTEWPPRGAASAGTWNGVSYAATAKWLVLRKKEKPSAELFSVAYVAEGSDLERPVTFVFNGGPGASSAYLHVGAVGPQRVDLPADGT